MQFKITEDAFYIDGKRALLMSAEIPYFKVPKSDWKRRMQLWKESGGNVIGSYCPWLLHEQEEGVYRFDAGDGVTDISEYLETAAEVGLGVIMRTGPYIYSELRHGGLPDWLLKKYPEVNAVDRKGNYIREGATATYLHPIFLDKVGRYMEKLCTIIAKYSAKNGGPVIMLQPDNEIYGLQIWNGDYDFSDAYAQYTKPDGRYPRYLKETFGTVEAVNKRYGTNHKEFTEFSPKDEPASGHAKWLWGKDWFHFYTKCGDEYIRFLIDIYERTGAGDTFSINAGNAGMNTYFKNIKQEYGNRLLLGSDHYYSLGQEFAQNNPTPQIYMRYWISMQELRLMKNPPSVMEFQFGTYADWPPCCAEDIAANLNMHQALGLQGLHGYIFTGGPNIKAAGRFTDSYDFGAPIAADGTIRPSYYAIKEFGTMMHDNPDMLTDVTTAEVQTYMQKDVLESYYLWGLLDDKRCVEPCTISGFIQRGIGTTLMSSCIQNIGCNWETADVKLPMILPSCGILSAKEQEEAVKFLQKGGRIFCMSVMPYLDENLQPCTILSDFLGGAATGEKMRDPYLCIAGVDNFASGLAFYPCTQIPEGAEILGKDEQSGKVACWMQGTKGGGTFAFLGAHWWHTQREQNQVIERILDKLGVVRHVFSDDFWSFAVLRGKRLWLANLTTGVRTPHIKISLDGKNVKDLGVQTLKQMSVSWINVE